MRFIIAAAPLCMLTHSATGRCTVKDCSQPLTYSLWSDISRGMPPCNIISCHAGKSTSDDDVFASLLEDRDALADSSCSFLQSVICSVSRLCFSVSHPSCIPAVTEGATEDDESS